jgi:hypothetical protein
MCESAVLVELAALREQNHELTSRVTALELKLQAHMEEDAVCDWLGKFYSEILINVLKDNGITQYNTWDELRTALYADESNTLRDKCCKLAGLEPRDWEACYTLKKTRNHRCHPRKTWSDAWSIVTRMRDITLRESLERVMLLIRTRTPL